MTATEILAKMPYGKDFLFVDEILKFDENGITGTYLFKRDLVFYESHFENNPVTPGVILTETMAQIGLVCFGINLLKDQEDDAKPGFAMTSNSIEFLKPVYPGDKVWVTSEKIYFRFNKLSCKVEMKNSIGEILCKGTIAGMLIQHGNE